MYVGVGVISRARNLGRARAWCSTTTWGSARWQQGLAALITAVLFWPQASVDPDVALDSSWQAGLALARMHDLAWGREVLFTYGPLGFLQTSAYYSFDQALVATIYQPLVVAALFLGIAAALRQRHPPMVSLLVAFMATGVIAVLHIGHGWAPGLEYPELAFLAAFAWATVPLLQQNPKRSTVFILCIVLGVVAGLQLLIKFNIGLSIVIIALAMSVLLDWKDISRHCATVAAFAASTLIFWLLAGQQPANLPTWLEYSVSVVTGYSEGMAVPLNTYTATGLMLSLAWGVVLAVIFVRGGPQIPRRFVAIVALATFICARAAIGRSDTWHYYVLVGAIVAAVAIVPFPRNWRRAFLAITGFIVVFGLFSESLSMSTIGDRVHDHSRLAAQAPWQAFDRLATLAVPGRLDQRIEQTKARQRALFAIPDRFLKTIGSSTVHIDPKETSAAWAYDLAWEPAPVFQLYQANTPVLDGLNSESLVSGPQFVLSRLSAATPAIAHDGRLGVQESPRYSRALLCDYTLTGVENRWALFTHTGPHCGPLTPLSQVEVRGNGTVTVPAPSQPGMAVLVGIDLQPGIADRLFQGLIAPLMIPTVAIDGTAYRLVAANAAEPFLVNSPAAVAGSNLEIHAHTIGVGHAPSLSRNEVTARLRFYELRVEQSPAVETVAYTSAPTAAPKTVIDSYGRWVQAIANDGMYLVGVDIFPGKYRNTGGAVCHWARLNSLDSNDSIQSNTSSSPQEIQLLVSDTGFLTHNCGIWQWVLPDL